MSLSSRASWTFEDTKNGLAWIITKACGLVEFNQTDVPKFLNRVEEDIEQLRDIRYLANYEIKENPAFVELIKRYKNQYCPNHFYWLFSNKNKERYLWLRIQIDDLLSEKGYIFNDKGKPQ